MKQYQVSYFYDILENIKQQVVKDKKIIDDANKMEKKISRRRGKY